MKYTSLGSGISSAGHYVLDFEVVNDRAEELSWEIDVVGQRWDGRMVLDGFRLTAPARGKANVTRFVQKSFLPDEYGGSAIIEVRGPGQFCTATVGGSRNGDAGMSVGISEENAERYRNLVMASAPSHGVHGGVRQREVAQVSPETLPADWRSFTEFSLIVAGREEWNGYSEEQRRALMRWMSSGGELVLVDSEAEAWSVAGFAGLKPGAYRRVGLGELRCEQARVSSESGKLRLSDEQLEVLTRRSPLRLFQAGYSSASDMPVLSGMPSTGTGLGWNLGFVLVIALLMGPVNLFLLAPAGRRHRLFWTLPATALVASLAVVVLACFRLGFGSEGHRVAVVALVPGNSEAFVAQQQFVRSGVRFSKAFRLPQTVALYDSVSDRSTRGSRSVRVRRGEEISGDWFSLNSDRQHALAGIVPLRSRVSVTFDAERAVVRSTFPKALREFHCRSEEGELWYARSVEPGVPVSLEKRPGKLLRDGTPGRRGVVEFGRFSAQTDGLEGVPLATDPDVRWTKDTVNVVGEFVLGAQEVAP